MAKYFLSFTSTFESLLVGKLTIADLAGGILVFGCKPEHVLMPFDRIPIEVTLNNQIKPKHQEKANTVRRDQVDAPVLKMWDVFAAQIRKANIEGRLLFLWDIGHPSYRHFSQDAVERGDQVFWHGKWAVPAPPVHRQPEIQTAMIDEAATLPEFNFDALIEETLSQSQFLTKS